MSRLQRALTRQQRRAFEREHARIRRELNRPVTLIQMHTYTENQRLHRRLFRFLRRGWRWLDQPARSAL